MESPSSEVLHHRKQGIKGLLEQDRLSFSIEADPSLSEAAVGSVNRQIREMRRPPGEVETEVKAPARVRERDLRYRIGVEMLPRSGILRVADGYLPALNRKGEPTSKRKPFFERRGERIHLGTQARRIQPTSTVTSTTASSPCRTIRRTGTRRGPD